MITEVAPKTVQSLRARVRQFFWRGVNKSADRVVDEVVVWVVDDIFSGKIKTRRQAAEAIGRGLSELFQARLVNR